eukprot:m51a1_g8670 putative protein kinase (621) ;mRNA; f:122130-124519
MERLPPVVPKIVLPLAPVEDDEPRSAPARASPRLQHHRHRSDHVLAPAAGKSPPLAVPQLQPALAPPSPRRPRSRSPGDDPAPGGGSPVAEARSPPTRGPPRNSPPPTIGANDPTRSKPRRTPRQDDRADALPPARTPRGAPALQDVMLVSPRVVRTGAPLTSPLAGLAVQPPQPPPLTLSSSQSVHAQFRAHGLPGAPMTAFPGGGGGAAGPAGGHYYARAIPTQVTPREQARERPQPQQPQPPQQERRSDAEADPVPLRPHRKSLTDAQIAAAHGIFLSLDENGDRQLDASEMHKMLKLLYPRITLPEVNRIYRQMDKNRSGRITIDEFLLAVEEFKWDLSPLEDIAASTPKSAAFEWEIPYRELQLEKRMGEGSFGVVFRGKWRGCTVAVKRTHSPRPAALRHEITLMSKMRHPSIVLFMGAATQDHSHLAIVTEFVSGGSLESLLRKHWSSLKPEWLLKASYDIAVGMAYLHSLAIVHRDLKPANILVDSDSGRIKLIDFGLSCVKPRGATLTEVTGSPIWMAPEVLRGDTYTEKVDVYSYAVVVLEILTNETPFVKMNLEELRVTVGMRGMRPRIPDAVGGAARDLITRCWSQDPQLRPAFSLVIQHPAFKTGVL